MKDEQYGSHAELFPLMDSAGREIMSAMSAMSGQTHWDLLGLSISESDILSL